MMSWRQRFPKLERQTLDTPFSRQGWLGTQFFGKSSLEKTRWKWYLCCKPNAPNRQGIALKAKTSVSSRADFCANLMQQVSEDYTLGCLGCSVAHGKPLVWAFLWVLATFPGIFLFFGFWKSSTLIITANQREVGRQSHVTCWIVHVKSDASKKTFCEIWSPIVITLNSWRTHWSGFAEPSFNATAEAYEASSKPFQKVTCIHKLPNLC